MAPKPLQEVHGTGFDEGWTVACIVMRTFLFGRDHPEPAEWERTLGGGTTAP